MSYDDHKSSGPHDDLPSVRSSQCVKCREPGELELDDGYLLCFKHADEYLMHQERLDKTSYIRDEERAEAEYDWKESA